MGYKFIQTEDGSFGLFDDIVDDIYHSSTGAYKEAIDKFILPAQIERFNNSTCKVLDICYGIGYNTKALLNYTIQNDLNINYKIDALEMNSDLVEISPFIKSKLISNEIDKFLLNSYLRDYKINFAKLKSQINKNKKYVSLNKPNFNKIMEIYGYSYDMLGKIKSNLHNIYYHNMSNRLKLGQKTYNLDKNIIKWHINDARMSILTLDRKYNIIFLDAFTASKQPLLWTETFLKEVILRLDKTDGVLLSYSSASPFRNSLLKLGLYVGKFYPDSSEINSTIASFNKNLIKYNLNDFEIGLLKTKAGISYEDENFLLTSSEIIKNREDKMKSSSLQSTSQYYKINNRKHGNLKNV